MYAVSGAPPEGAPITGPTRLRFEYSTAGNELHVVKEFSLDPSGYIVSFTASVPEPHTILWGPAVGDLGEASRYVQQARGLLSQGNKVQRISAKDLGNKPGYEGDFQFVGVDDNYFMTAAFDPGPARITFQAVSIPPPADSKDAARDLMSYTIQPQGRDTELKFLRDLWTFLDGSQIVDFFRATLIPLFFTLFGFLVPDKIEAMYPKS